MGSLDKQDESKKNFYSETVGDPSPAGKPLKFETVCEGRLNIVIEKHPYLVGYGFLLSITLLAAFTHLKTFALSFLFLYLISDFMTNNVHRHVRFIPKIVLFSILYIFVTTLIVLLTYHVIPNFVRHSPAMVSQLQGEVIGLVKDANQKWQLSRYIDLEELRSSLLKTSAGLFGFLMENISPIYKGFIQFIFALVINLFFYYESDKVKAAMTRAPGSMMDFLYGFTASRLQTFYFYFKKVMGGQLIISLINAVISGIAIVLLELPHPLLLIFLVFFCGLFPVVGNLVSNSVLVVTAFMSVGLWASAICLILLISIHKLEYFLNSRIIGSIVRLPMTMILGSLVICEVLFGIPGLILAIPLVLFIRYELEHVPGFCGDLSRIEPPKEQDGK